jgi:hypothetical protein
MIRPVAFIFAVALTGCVSPRPQTESTLYRDASARFDLTAVRAFLKGLIRDHPSVDGISIEKSTVGDAWVLDESWLPVGLKSGDWTFQRSIGSESEFSLSYRVSPALAVVFHCSCESRGNFQMVSVGSEELVPVTPSFIEAEENSFRPEVQRTGRADGGM